MLLSQVCRHAALFLMLTTAFVYKGAGKKQNANAHACQKDKVCQRLACDIQYCLARNNYQEKRCERHIEAWKKCCERVNRGLLGI